MAGQKITKRQFAKLAKIGEEVIFDVYVQTRSVAKCIEALDLKMGKTTFYRWLNSDEERRARWNENMKRIAQDLVEESLEIAHGVTDKDDVPAARLKVETNRWTATKSDRVKFGDTREGVVAVQVNFGDQFLDALKELDEIKVVEAEVVEVEE